MLFKTYFPDWGRKKSWPEITLKYYKQWDTNFNFLFLMSPGLILKKFVKGLFVVYVIVVISQCELE